MASPQGSLELAKQGDPAAIAQLINQALKAKDITARVSRQGTVLKVMLEADEVPNQPTLVSYLQKNLEKLGITAIARVELYGKQRCAAVPAWRQSFNLESFVPQPPPVDAVSSPPEESAPNPPSVVQKAGSWTPGISQKTYQIIFGGVMALILMMIGANLRSLHTLLAKPQTTRQVSLNGTSFNETKPGVYQAKIINRIGGVPVIMVTFNGVHTSPMIVDTGASGIVITKAMASTLGIVPVGQSIAQTANGYTSFDVGYVDSIEVDGAKIARVPVAIGLADMDIGLLGHDFFGDFDVTVRQDVVEFSPRESSSEGEAFSN